MATINQMVANRLPDEAALFADALDTFVEEAGAVAGFEGVAQEDMSVLQKSLVADMAARSLILPAMSHYKKAIAEAEGEGAGTAKFADKLAFLEKMDAKLATDITDKQARVAESTDTGVAMVVVGND